MGFGFLDGRVAMRKDFEGRLANTWGEAYGGDSSPGQALASLVASDLRERFYSWRGLSGRRYVCSVFSGADALVVSEFTAAAVVGVSVSGARRRPVCVMSSREFLELLHGQTEGAGVYGVDEWHVHFEVDEHGLRDLAGSLFN